jgi:hypothetical protein
MATPQQRLRDLYGIDFPDSFFAFADFVTSLPDDLPLETLHIWMETPFKIALGKPVDSHTPHLIWASRWYDDPPEFLTILRGDMDGLHWGYYIDDPAEQRFPVASYWSRDAFEFSIERDVFEAVRCDLELAYRDYLDYSGPDPASADSYQQTLEQIDRLRTELRKYGTSRRSKVGDDYLEAYVWHDTRRWRRPVAMTRDRLGICVPAKKYRPLGSADVAAKWDAEPAEKEITKLRAKALKLLGEGYPGAALKLGKDLWLSRDHRETCYDLLDAAYEALERPWLRQMLQVAREYRVWCDASRSTHRQK